MADISNEYENKFNNILFPGRPLNILCTFNLRPVSTGYVIEHLHGLQDLPSGDCTYPLVLSHSHVTLAKVP